MGTKSTEFDFSINNLYSLINLEFYTIYTIDQEVITKLLYQVQHIEELHLNGKFSYLNLNNLINLKMLSLEGVLNTDFNFELFKNLSNQLEKIRIYFLSNIDDKTLFELFDGHIFPNLKDFSIRKCNMKKLQKEFFSHFPILKQLFIMDCNIKMIEQDSFTNLKHLNYLILKDNPLEFIEKNTFSNLKNLQTVYLSYTKLTKLDPEFLGLGNSVKLTYYSKAFDSDKTESY